MSGAVAKTPLGVFEVYRYFHPQGGSKDWAVAIINGEVHTRYGKTGAALQGGVPKPRFTDAHAEMNRRVSEKTQKGYKHLARAVIFDDGSWEPENQVQPEPAEAQSTAPQGDDTTVFFEIHVKKEGMFPEFLRACRRTFDVLKKAGVPVHAELTEEFSFVFRIGDWQFEAGDNARVGARNSVSRKTREGAGNVKQEDGVYPLLFLLSLKRSSPAEVGLAWKDGIEVTEKLHHEQDVLSMFGTDLDGIRPVAVALGLAEERIDLSTVGSESSLYF